MRRRSNLMVLLGIAFFVVGVAVVYLVARDDDGGGGSVGQDVRVVVASRAIAAGSLADELIQQGALRETELPIGQRLPDAAGSLVQLQGGRFVTGFAKDQQITLPGVQSLTASIEVPKGYEAIAVQIDFVAGAAGYVRAGDRINLYSVLKSGGVNLRVPRAELLLTNVEVLDVNIDIPARRATASADPTQPAAQRAGDTPITYLLALRTDDVEKVIFSTEFQGLYASLVNKDARPSGPTLGRDVQNILDEEAPAALAG